MTFNNNATYVKLTLKNFRKHTMLTSPTDLKLIRNIALNRTEWIAFTAEVRRTL